MGKLVLVCLTLKSANGAQICRGHLHAKATIRIDWNGSQGNFRGIPCVLTEKEGKQKTPAMDSVLLCTLELAECRARVLGKA